ncbi:leucine-rich repeat and hypothetical protein [Limosa lapponica baueri]|uniref:Uncharacterized protein n=1 Tax=Limosa lapponica baueri TaxID=1758121 RepID=A0A2I0T5E9_LIMLA|nr:leucine-rich repeat and hypothetical protein [Limosa lapponica baueri]
MSFVNEDFENVAADLVEHKRALFEFEQKEKEMASLIQDLTSIVKEQKEKIAELTKSNEEATANLKVYYVEEEMRQLLQETANNKKAMENKVRRLTQALNDIQQDLEVY